MRKSFAVIFWSWLCVLAAPAGATPPYDTAVINLHAAGSPVVVVPAAASVRFASPVCRVAGASWAELSEDPFAITLKQSELMPTWVTLEMGTISEGCNSPKPYHVFFSEPASLTTTPGKVTVHPQGQLVEVIAEDLTGQQLLLLHNGKLVNGNTCLGRKACTVGVQPGHVRDWLRGGATGVVVWPSPVAPLPNLPSPSLWQRDGSWRALQDGLLQDVTFEFGRPLIEVREVNAASAKSLIPIAYPEAIADVSCVRARCALTAEGIEVYGMSASALTLTARITFVEGVRRRLENRYIERESIDLNIVRCGIRTPGDVPVLAGATGHLYYIALSADCFEGSPEDLALETRPPTVSYVKAEVQSQKTNWRFFELVIDKVPADIRQLEMTIKHRAPPSASLGAVKVNVLDDYRPVGTHISLPDQGSISFVPSNRSAHISLVFAEPHLDDLIWLQSRRGAYDVIRGDNGDTYIQAAGSANGAMPLRLAYISPAMNAFLGREQPLVFFDTDSRFSMRAMNLPVPLTEPIYNDTRVVRVECRSGKDTVEIPAGRTVSIPFSNRNSCSLVVDRSAIPESYGEQRLRIIGESLNEILTVAHHNSVLTIALAAENKKMFDSLNVSVGHEYSGGHYDLSPRQNLGAEARYRIVVGDRNFRFSASTSLPTGLFRFGDDRGAVPFSAGAVARIVWLYNEGQELPIGLELGMLGTGLSNVPHLSIIAGVGFSVPVLNPNTSLQTSFNLHAWIEYSPTRQSPDSPWAFLFGPSFAVGRFAADF